MENVRRPLGNTTDRPVKSTKSEKSPQWQFGPRRTGVNFDHRDIRERLINNKCRFDTERRRLGPTYCKSVHTLVKQGLQPYNNSFLHSANPRIKRGWVSVYSLVDVSLRIEWHILLLWYLYFTERQTQKSSIKEPWFCWYHNTLRGNDSIQSILCLCWTFRRYQDVCLNCTLNLSLSKKEKCQ